MDLGFFRRQQGFSSRAAARLEYRVLVATLEAMQAGSTAAKAEVRAMAKGSGSGNGHDPLIELVLGGSGWRQAIRAQGGCFHADHAGGAERRCKGR